MNWKQKIVANPSILAGKPVIKGTRLSVDFVLSLFAKGWSETQILENYPQIDTGDLKAVFAFAQACLADEENEAVVKPPRLRFRVFGASSAAVLRREIADGWPAVSLLRFPSTGAKRSISSVY